MYLALFMDMKGSIKRVYTSSCAHALLRPIFEDIRVGVPLWLQMLQATGALKYNKNNDIWAFNIKVIISLTNGFY